jgi:hypothetical protein
VLESKTKDAYGSKAKPIETPEAHSSFLATYLAMTQVTMHETTVQHRDTKKCSRFSNIAVASFNVESAQE